MEIVIQILIFILGACAGSFVNMLLYRTAHNYKLEKKTPKVKDDKRSYCDYCGKQLPWYENVPVISWLVLGGRTRCCNRKLPASYPLVEIGMGILFLITNYELGITNYLQIILGFIIITLLVFAAVFDIRYMILPDFSTLILVGIAFLGVVFDEPNIIPYLLAAAGAGGFLLMLHIMTKGKGMGMGDVKYAVFMGMFLGWPKVVIAFYTAFISGAIYGIIMIVMKKLGRKSLIPFGPFLILGTIVAWWAGDSIVKFLIQNY